MEPNGFRYFQAPTANMSRFAPSENCSFCAAVGPCFEFEASTHGCLNCLRQGRFYFAHATEVGYLSPDEGLHSQTRAEKRLAREFKRVNFAELLKTPQFVTWQGEKWLVHCDDFMVYVGEWEASDFVKNAADGDGRRLFVEMVDNDAGRLWDETISPGVSEPANWHFQIHAFKCGHCGRLRGHWDCM